MANPRTTTIGDDLRQNLTPQRLISGLLAGFIAGLLEIVFSIGLSALVFSGELSNHLGAGIGLALIGGLAAGIIIALFTTIPGIVSGNQDVPAAVLAVITASLVSAVAQSTSPDQLLPTTLVTIALITLICALCFYLIGRFHLGNIVRFLPYPVIGGFLAGTGWLLVTGGIEFLAGAQTSSLNLFAPETLIRWLPGFLFGILLFAISVRSKSIYALPGVLMGGILLFALVVRLVNPPAADLVAQGWILDSLQTDITWRPLTPAMFAQTNWGAIAAQIPNIITLVLVSTIALLLNVSSLELITHEETDLSKELTTAGFANLAAGLVGGLVNFQMLGISTLNFRIGARSRIPGLVAAALMGLVFFTGSDILALLPKPIMGSVLLLLGISFLYDWLYLTWFTLPKIDYLIVWLILLVIAATGFLEGITVGLLLTVVMFVVNYSRTDVVHHELSAKTYSSRVARPMPERDTLSTLGNKIQILELQGFIFFGTAAKLLEKVRPFIAPSSSSLPRFILLDFRRTIGLDSTAMLSFQKLEQLADASAVTILLTALPDTIKRQFIAADLIYPTGHIRLMDDLDQGVEWCEDQLLSAAHLSKTAPASLRTQLAALMPDSTNIDTMLAYFDRLELPAGHRLIKQGAPADELFLIESGRLTAQLEQPGQSPVRLETMGYGHVVGELGFYQQQQKRTAAVVADVDSVVYRLTRARLAEMESAEPQAAALFHHRIILLLTDRVTHLVTAVNALNQ